MPETKAELKAEVAKQEENPVNLENEIYKYIRDNMKVWHEITADRVTTVIALKTPKEFEEEGKNGYTVVDSCVVKLHGAVPKEFNPKDA